MKRIAVISNNPVVYNKIRLLLREVADVELIAADANTEEYALIFADTQSAKKPMSNCVRLGEGGDIPLPFRHEEILDAVLGADDNRDEALTLSPDGRHVYLVGESIKLTEVEYKLLEVISSADGYISKSELLRTVWGDGYDEGVVNVYVHYLRRKLEKDGKRVIISSRNEGYKIDEKYRRRG